MTTKNKSKKLSKTTTATFGPRGGYQPGYGAVPPTPYNVAVDLTTCKITQANPTNITVSANPSTSLTAPITVNTGYTYSTNWSNNWSNNATVNVGKVTITDKDIDIDGVSLRETLAKVNERLAIFQPNPELEADFEQLRNLRDQYVELERELMEKAQTWNTLKNTDTK